MGEDYLSLFSTDVTNLVNEYSGKLNMAEISGVFINCIIGFYLQQMQHQTLTNPDVLKKMFEKFTDSEGFQPMIKFIEKKIDELDDSENEE